MKQSNKLTTKNIAIMGVGTVGSGTYQIITEQAVMLKQTRGLDIKVLACLDKSKDELIRRGISAAVATEKLEDILRNDKIDVVVETMGGVEPARTFILKCFASGKSVVSANKELIAKHGAELEAAASDRGVGFFYEAAVAGGIPIIRVLQQGMQANNLLEIMGIVNGTTNFILTKMAEEGASYLDVLKQAQDLGFAEADPTADVDGFDSMYKLSILAALGFHSPVHYSKIYREGITKISAADMANAKNLGYIIKLLAIAKRTKKGIEARVHPTFVPLTHPLANVRNEFNAVFLKGDSVDDVMLYGRGAGALPTASAIVSDVVVALTDCKAQPTVFSTPPVAAVVDNFESGYYLAITVADKSGVLARIAEVFEKYKVSVSQLIQDKEQEKGVGARLAVLVHPTLEKSMLEAKDELAKLKEVKSVDSFVRVL